MASRVPLALRARAALAAPPGPSTSAAIAAVLPTMPPSHVLAAPHRRAFSSSSASPAAAGSSSSAASSSPASGDAPAVHMPPLARVQPSLYLATLPQSQSAVASLAARLQLLPSSLAPNQRRRRLRLVSQACRHPSYAYLVRKAKRATATLAYSQGRSDRSDGSEQDARPAAEVDARDVPLVPLVRNGAPATTTATARARATDDALEAEDATASDNAQLSALGNSLLGLLGAEQLHLRYPHLPTRVVKAALAAFVGTNTLADVATELGLSAQGLLRWDRDAVVETAAAARRGGEADAGEGALRKAGQGRLLASDVMAQAVRALVGVMFQELGMAETRHFVHTRLLSRQLDVSQLLKFNEPKRTLSYTCAKYGLARPASRLLAETGRLSISPVFVVGVYSGGAKLGEGSGSSLKMAEYRAAEDALRRLFLSQTPEASFDLPSSTLDGAFAPSAALPRVWRPDVDGTARRDHGEGEDERGGAAGGRGGGGTFRPQPLGTSEVVFGSKR